MNVQNIQPFHKVQKMKHSNTLGKIRSFKKKGYSVRQIMKLMGWKSPNAVNYYTNRSQ